MNRFSRPAIAGRSVDEITGSRRLQADAQGAIGRGGWCRKPG